MRPMSPPTPAAAPRVPPLQGFVLKAPPSRPPDDLSPNARRAVVVGMLGAHVLAGWALLQVPAVREAVIDVAPMMVELIAPTPEQAPPPPPKPTPQTPPPRPVLAAQPLVPPPTPTFVAAPPPPEPPPLAAPTAPPVPPAPVAPPAPPAPAPAVATAAPPAPRAVKLSGTDWVREPDLNPPLASLRLGEQGTATVRAVFDTAGKPIQVQLLKSSGFPRLDQEALSATKRALVKPLLENGVPVVFTASFQLEFKLER